MNTNEHKFRKMMGLGILAGLMMVAGVARGERIRDVARLKSQVPNELVGMGIVTGLAGTGDGGDFLPAMRPLKELMKRFDDPVAVERELKNAKNVAIVMLSIPMKPSGAHFGDTLDVKVTAIAAKSLKGGRLFIVPMFAPTPGQKVVLGSASGDLMLDDPDHPTAATISGGGVMIEDVLPEEIKGNRFTLVLDPKAASHERSAAIAETINQEVSTQTNGKAIAVAIDDTSVDVEIPAAEQAHPTAFIGWVLGQQLPPLTEPAVVKINTKTKTIIMTEEVELAPTIISQRNLTITVGTPGQPANPPGSRVPFVALDQKRTGNAKLKDLEEAFNLLKVSADDRIAIIIELNKMNALKGKLIIE